MKCIISFLKVFLHKPPGSDFLISWIQGIMAKEKRRNIGNTTSSNNGELKESKSLPLLPVFAGGHPTEKSCYFCTQTYNFTQVCSDNTDNQDNQSLP